MDSLPGCSSSDKFWRVLHDNQDARCKHERPITVGSNGNPLTALPEAGHPREHGSVRNYRTPGYWVRLQASIPTSQSRQPEESHPAYHACLPPEGMAYRLGPDTPVWTVTAVSPKERHTTRTRVTCTDLIDFSLATPDNPYNAQSSSQVTPLVFRSCRTFRPSLHASRYRGADAGFTAEPGLGTRTLLW